MTFGQKVRKCRKLKRLSQNALAELSGISLRTIYGYEAGTTYPRTNNMLQRLADALDVTTEELLDDKPTDDKVISEFDDLSQEMRARVVTEQAISILLGEYLADDQKDEMVHAIMDAYWESKQKNREKNDTTL